MYRYLLFDLDGTLTDPWKGITRSVQYALSSFGIREERMEVLLQYIGPPLVDSFMNESGLCRRDAEKAVAKYRERYTAIGMYENSIIPGIPALLADLKKAGFVMCVATSKPGFYTLPILDRYGIRKYFDFVGAATLDGAVSRKTEVIDLILKNYPGAGREEYVMIGDRKEDILGAKERGIASIGVRFGYAKAGELEEACADRIADTVEDLKELLLG